LPATIDPRHETPKESENSLHFKLPLLGGLLVVTATLGAAQNPNNAEAQIGIWLKQLTLEEKINYLVGTQPADASLPNSTILR